jgi:CDP-4-dehydro-6-deoxyglucose reductase
MNGGKEYRVELAGQVGQTWTVTDETILDGALRAGIDLPHDCTLGGCGTCRIRVLQGGVTYQDDELPFGLTEEEAELGYALACQARPAGDIVIEVPQPAERPAPQRRQAVIRGLRLLAPDVLHMMIDVPECGRDAFLPGQYLNVILEDGATRSFSMASAPNDEGLDFYLRRFESGRFTGEVAGRLSPGDALEVEMPLGSFLYHPEDDRPILMVATGTGIAPIKAIVESLLEDPGRPPIDLYWGIRTEEDIFVGRVFEEWEKRSDAFRFVPVLSRPGSDWVGRRGYVQDAVVEDIQDLSEHSVYLCGGPAMIVDAKKKFLACGASSSNLYVEGFTPGVSELTHD